MKKVKPIKPKYETGCIVCALNFFLKWGNLNGIFLYKYSCPHTNKKLVTCKMKYLSCNIVLTLSQMVILGVGVRIVLLDILGQLKTGDSTLILSSAIFLFHYLLSIGCLLVSLLFQWEPTYFQNLLYLTQKGLDDYNIEYIFTKRAEREIRRWFTILTILVILIAGMYN